MTRGLSGAASPRARSPRRAPRRVVAVAPERRPITDHRAGSRRILAPLLLAALLAGCAQTGDFGRPAPSAWNALVEGTGRVAARLRDEPVSRFALTDDETELRDRAWRFLMPAQEGGGFSRAVFVSALANMTRARVPPAAWHPSDPALYHAALVGGPSRSPASRYRRLSEDAIADARLLPVFAGLAARVVAADAVRLRGLPFVQTIDDAEVRDAAMRVAENRCLIAWVRHEAGARVAGYRFALERLLVETPQAEAIGPERALAGLEERRGVLEGLLPPGAPALCGFPGEPALVALASPPFAPPLVTKD